MTSMDSSKTQIVSFSGGRTSAFLVYLIESLRKKGSFQEPVEYVYMDTGAEHPETYDFIRKVVADTGIKLTCLQGDFNQPVGKRQGQKVKVVPLVSLKHDPVNGPYGQMMRKHGVPTVSSAWCTTRMKEEVCQKYCNAKYGKRNYAIWLGIRADEPRRLHIGKSEYRRYMAEITDAEKSDILKWWSKKEFDLQIPEHLGNCVFCFKKSLMKVALAIHDEPKLLDDWRESLNQANDRLNQPLLKFEEDGLSNFGVRFWVQHIPKGTMYRNVSSVDDVIAMFPIDDGADHLRQMVYRNSKDSGGCSESCEAFVCQPELEF